MDNIFAIFNDKLKMPETYMLEMAEREKTLRKKKKLSRAALSEKSNVSYGSLKRFEETGNISLSSLVKLSIALECPEGLEGLFPPLKPQSIEDIINGND